MGTGTTKKAIAIFVVAFCSSLVISTVPKRTARDAPPSEPPKIPRPDHRALVDSSLLPLYDMTNFFLEDMIQPRYLTWMEDKKGVDLKDQDSVKNSFENHYWDWVEYWVGFAICAVIGILAIIVMPIIGITIACCRCCGYCGGKTDPNEGKHSTCKRISCGISLIVVTGFLLTGSILVFVLNDEMRDRMQGSTTVFDDLSRSLNTVDKFLDTTVLDLNVTVLGGYTAVKDDVFQKLDNIPQDAIRAIENKTQVVTALTELDEFVTSDLPKLNISLTAADHLVQQLRDLTNDLETELVATKDTILQSILYCVEAECNETRETVENLGLAANFTIIVVGNSLFAVETALVSDISGHVDQAKAVLVDIAEIVNATVIEHITEAKKVADDVEKEIAKFVTDVEDAVDSINFKKAVDGLDDAKEAVDWPWDIVYWSIVALGIMILVIVLCNVVGVLCGTFCARPQPDTCGCDQVMGADWLLAGIGFTFIFYWLFMMVVMVLFVAGGVFHTEGCRNLVEYETPESRAVLDIMDYWINDTIYEETNGDVSMLFTEVYESCQRNKSFYAALDLADKGHDLDEILDLTPIQEAINELKKAAADIDIGTVNVYPETLQTLIVAMDEAFKSELDFTLFYTELAKPITTYALDDLADDLDDLLGEPGVNDTLLGTGTDELRNLSKTHVEPAEHMAVELKSHLKTSESILNTTSLSEINTTLSNANVTINTKGNDILHHFVNETADEVYHDIEVFVTAIDQWIRYQCGNCWPMYEAFTFAIDSSCVTTLYPLNGFWYSMGIVIFFLIPSIIIAYALVTEYRKTIKHNELNPDYSDSDTSPLYDAYKIDDPNAGSAQMMMEIDENQPMAGADNPIYMSEEFRIPRPAVYATGAYSSAGYPATSYPDKKQSPPPSYTDEFDETDSINTKL